MDDKVLLTIAEELRELKTEVVNLGSQFNEKVKNDTHNAEPDYVAQTEQRFINLNQKVDKLLAIHREQKFIVTLMSASGIALGVAVILKELVNKIILLYGHH